MTSQSTAVATDTYALAASRGASRHTSAACDGLLGVSSCHYTYCTCAAGLVAVLLVLRGPRVNVQCVGVSRREQPYSNLFPSL